MMNVSDQVIGEKLPKSPKTAELLSNLSGVMINTDFVLDYPRAQPPNFINVGGLQIKADPGAIPADMLSFINGAPEGILLFTMGFIFNAKVNRIFPTKLDAHSYLNASIFFSQEFQDCNLYFTSRKSD